MPKPHATNKHTHTRARAHRMLNGMGQEKFKKLTFPNTATIVRSGSVALAVIFTAFRYSYHGMFWHAFMILAFTFIGYTMYVTQDRMGTDWTCPQVWIWHGSLGFVCWLHVGAVHYSKYALQ